MPGSDVGSWIESQFSRDPASGVYISRGSQSEFSYSDGDEVELRLLDTVRGASDRAVGSIELELAITDFASRYHLSSRRANLLRPICDIFHGRILILGAGCGVEARFIGETGLEVWAVEGSRRRAAICAERCRDLPNVSVFCEPIEEFRPPVQFDVVTLIGVLEYSPRTLRRTDAPAQMIEICRNFLLPSGVLVVAIENYLGLKYFAGAPEDHTGVAFANMNGHRGVEGIVTFGRTEIERLMRDAHLPYLDFLYPFPDYKFPRVIVSPSAVRELGEDLGDIVRTACIGESSLSYERLFSEEMCWPTIIQNGLLGDLANSFLVVARQTPGEVLKHDRLVYSYADARRREFGKETVIARSGDDLRVRRRKLFAVHALPDQSYSQQFRDEYFTRGRLLLGGFLEVVNRPGWSERDIEQWGRPWFEFLKSQVLRDESSNAVDPLLPRGLVDCTPSNLVETDDKTLKVFDQEWVAAEPVPLRFVVFRGLFGLFVQVTSIEVPADTVPRSIALLCQQVMLEWELPVTSQVLEALARQECLFQEIVSGIPCDPEHYLRAALPPVRYDNRTPGTIHREIGKAFQESQHVMGEALAAFRHEVAKRDDLLGFFRRHQEDMLASFSDALRGASAAEEKITLISQVKSLEKSLEGEVGRANEESARARILTSQLGELQQIFENEKSHSESLAGEVCRLKESLVAAELRAEDGVIRANDLAAEISALRRNLDSEQSRAQQVSARAEQLAAEMYAVKEVLAKEKNRAGYHEVRIDALTAEVRKLRNDLETERRRFEEETEQYALACEASQQEGELRVQLCRDILSGIEAFRARFWLSLIAYRNQRAWQVMLLLRKAYSLLLRRGFKGRGEFVRWILTLPWKKDWGLAEYDLEFPDIGQDMPKALWLNAVSTPARRSAPPASPASRPQQVHRYDVVVLPVFEFDFRYQRPQQLASQFAMAGHRVFWISPSRMSSNSGYKAIGLQPNIWEIHLSCAIPNLYNGVLDNEAVATLSNSLKHLYQDQAISESVAVLQFPFWRQVGARLKQEHGAKVLYDCIDHWDTFPQLGEFARAEEGKLAAEADILSVTAVSLFDKHARRGLNPVLVRNGADFEFFHTPLSNSELDDIPRPIVGYFGAIADWFDFDLVRRAATDRPSYSFVLIGGLGLEENVVGGEVGKLRGLKNVHLLGHKNYDRIPSYLRQFDACMIPFRLNEVTMATDPVKLYEYLSQSKPVVATAMAELEPFADLIYIGRSQEEFIGHLDTAVNEKPAAMRDLRLEFARTNSWRARYQVLDAAAVGAFPMVSILIVSYNSVEFIRPCLDSLLQNTSYPRYELIVVDNASTDGTVEVLREYARRESRISLTCLAENRGFAASNNLAAGQARGEYLIFLNIDTVVTAGWIGRLLSAARRNPDAGLLGPVTNWAGNEMRIDVPYYNCREMEEFALDVSRNRWYEVMEIDVAPLFCTLLHRSVWEKIGELDESFGIGMFEDDDYSLRVRNAGLRVLCVEDCFIHHFGQGSFGKMDPATYGRLFESNKQRFEEKWGRRWTAHRYRSSATTVARRHTPAEFCGVQ